MPLNDLKIAISKDLFLDDILQDVKNGAARVLKSETAVAVFKIFTDSKNKIELFISAFQGSNGRKFMVELIDFCTLNKINYIGLQTKRLGLVKVVSERFDFKVIAKNAPFYVLKREVII